MATKQKAPAYVAPDDQITLQDRITELREQLAQIGPGKGLVYREDAHEVAARVFRDWDAEQAARRAFRVAELRAKICLELATAGDDEKVQVFLNDADDVDREELAKAIDAAAAPGYVDIISPHKKSDDVERRQKLEAQIVQLERAHAILEAREARAESDRRIAELEALNGKDGGDGLA